MLEKQSSKDLIQPFYPIPIITTPQPLISSTNKFQVKNELQIYKQQNHRLTKQNNLLRTHLTEVTREKEVLQRKFNNIQNKQMENGWQNDRKKRVRRIASQIVRQFDCYLEKCGKSYGTQASLVQHIKLKHPNVYATKQYEDHVANLRKKIDANGEKITVISPLLNANTKL